MVFSKKIVDLILPKDSLWILIKQTYRTLFESNIYTAQLEIVDYIKVRHTIMWTSGRAECVYHLNDIVVIYVLWSEMEALLIKLFQ